MNDRNRVNKLAADRTHLDRLQGQNEWLKCAEDNKKIEGNDDDYYIILIHLADRTVD